MENRTMISSLLQTPSFSYETDKIQGSAIWASRYWHRHRNRHWNIAIVFCTVQITFKVERKLVLYIFVTHVTFNKVLTYG